MVESSDSKEILAESLKAEKAKSDKDDYRYNTDNVIINLQYHFSCFFRSIKAITFCIILSLIGVKLTHNPSTEFIFAKSFNEFWDKNSLYYVLSICVPVIIFAITIGAFFHFILLYYKWETVYSLMLNGSFLYLISATFGLFVVNICINYGFIVDSFTFGFIIWNFSVLSVLTIRWKGSLNLKKAFLIISQALSTTFFINHLSITLLWMIIIVLSFDDIFTVLHRYGPLNLIIQILEERDANIPAGMSYPLGGDDDDDSDELFETAEEQINKRGPELGLGDFSMFSLFLGIVSLEGNWFLTFICYAAIMIGMFITEVVMLAYNYRAFPALPFPIFCAMSTYYLSKAFVTFSPFDLFLFCFNTIFY